MKTDIELFAGQYVPKDNTAISEMESMSTMGEGVTYTWDAMMFDPTLYKRSPINSQSFSCHRLTGYNIIQTANTM